MTQVRPILLVEDSANDLELTLTAFKDSNLKNEIAVARDGEEAVDYLFYTGRFAGRARGNPAVVVLDLNLPKIDGIEVLRTIRSRDQTKTLPVVMLTSSREESDVVKSYDLGVNAYVVKPVRFDEFLASVRQLGLFWAICNEPPPLKGGSG